MTILSLELEMNPYGSSMHYTYQYDSAHINSNLSICHAFKLFRHVPACTNLLYPMLGIAKARVRDPAAVHITPHDQRGHETTRLGRTGRMPQPHVLMARWVPLSMC